MSTRLTIPTPLANNEGDAPGQPQRVLDCYQCFRRIEFWALQALFRRISVGSSTWYVIQERLSNRSLVGLDLEMRSWFLRHSVRYCSGELWVAPHTIIQNPDRVEIGDQVYINRNVMITARAPVTIGNNVLIGPQVIINSGNHRFADRNQFILEQGHDAEPVVIEDDVWIGANCSILSGVTIGTGAVIAAGSVVTRDIPSCSVVGGVPAKVISHR